MAINNDRGKKSTFVKPLPSTNIPANIEAEKAVIGSALLSKNALLNVLTSLEEDDFYLPKHRTLFRAIKNVHEKSLSVDALTVFDELTLLKEIDHIGGVDYIQQCTESMVAFANLEFYINILIDQSVLRKMLNAVQKIDTNYRTEAIENVNDFILDSEDLFKRSIERRRVSTFKKVEEVAEKVKAELGSAKPFAEGDDEDVTGVTSGFKRLNALTQGFHPEEYIIIGARPSVGKTTFALNIALNAARLGKVGVAIFSLEMSSESLVKKLISSLSFVSLKSISMNRVIGQDKVKVAAAIDEISNANIYIDDSPGLRLSDIQNKSKKLLAADPNLGMIVVDYLGLITSSSDADKRSSDNRQEEVRKISQGLKQLARDLKVPVIIVSQLSREVDKRKENRRPMLSDLRESGAIEQDADVVLLLYRPDYYKNGAATEVEKKKTGQLTDDERFEMAKKAQERQLGQEMPGNASYVEVIVAKNRNGQTGRCGLFFYKDFAKFETPSKEWEEKMLNATDNESED